MKIKAGTDIEDTESGLRVKVIEKQGYNVLQIHQYCKSTHRVRDITFNPDGDFTSFGRYDRGG